MTHLELPPLNPVPENISDYVERLLHSATRPPGLGEWLLELIKSSGHLSLGDDMRWRLLCMIWLTAEYDIEQGWPYLMWLNQGEPVIAEHLSDILHEAANDFLCHPQLAAWIANAQDERLINFFEPYRNIPSASRLPTLLRRLMSQRQPTAFDEAIEMWLTDYCAYLAVEGSPYMRRWQLLTVAWYAARYNPTDGLTYLRRLSQSAPTLPMSDNKLLMDTADELNVTPALIQAIADCPEPAVKQMLQDFGHPNLELFVETLLQQPPDFAYLENSVTHAPTDAQTFNHYRDILNQAGISRQTANLLDLACGPLAPLTVMFGGLGYNILGVDLYIPPAYWPVSFIQRLWRGKYVKAWQAATDDYYQTLSRVSGIKVDWKKVNIGLVDLTRLPQTDRSFEGVLCNQYLQHAPDVAGVLAEAARVLKPNGLFVADIRPYPALTGAFLPPDIDPAWAHLRADDVGVPPNTILNQWWEADYRAALEKQFTIEQWLTEQDEFAQTRLTPEIQAELAAYEADELTRQQVIIVARKK